MLVRIFIYSLNRRSSVIGLYQTRCRNAYFGHLSGLTPTLVRRITDFGTEEERRDSGGTTDLRRTYDSVFAQFLCRNMGVFPALTDMNPAI